MSDNSHIGNTIHFQQEISHSNLIAPLHRNHSNYLISPAALNSAIYNELIDTKFDEFLKGFSGCLL